QRHRVRPDDRRRAGRPRLLRIAPAEALRPDGRGFRSSGIGSDSTVCRRSAEGYASNRILLGFYGGIVADAYIVGGVRTPVGKRNVGLSTIHSTDLAAHTLTALIERTGVDPAAVDDVIMGCVSQIGPQSLDIARNAWLSAGLPESVPGVTIDRQCGSSQQRSEEHTSELQSRENLVCRLLLEKKKKKR